MKVKDRSVELYRIHPAISSRFDDLDDIMYRFTKSEAVITSGHESYSGDGVHKKSSKHYVYDQHGEMKRLYGCAIDIRSYTVKEHERDDCLTALQELFTSPQFTVLYEGDHYHIQYNKE